MGMLGLDMQGLGISERNRLGLGILALNKQGLGKLG